MQANNLEDSSNQGAGEASLAPDINGLGDFINPSITLDHHMNAVPTCTFSSFDNSEVHTKLKQNSGSISSNSFVMPENIATCTPYIQQPGPNRLLQVPTVNNTHHRPLSPSPKRSPPLGDIECSEIAGVPPTKSIKSKPLTSAKKAEEVSEELASEIARIIDLHTGPPEKIQSTIKRQILLKFHPALSRKRSATMASLKDDQDGSKKRKITCDQCSATTARQCDMRYLHHATVGEPIKGYG